MDVGHELRQARERREMSLQQLSRLTKISARVLQVIESSDESRLPARVFTRGFVRAYAIELGLDPAETVRRYFEQFGERASETPAEIERAPEPRPATAWYEALRSAAPLLQGPLGTATALTLVGITILVLSARSRETPQSVAASPQPPAAASAAIAPAVSAQPAVTGTSGSAPAVIEPLHIAIAPTGPCWVQATMNDDRLFGGLLTAGDRRTIDAPSEVTLRVGDPATFAFTINGRPAQIAGAPAQAVTVRVSRENYTQFLAREPLR